MDLLRHLSNLLQQLLKLRSQLLFKKVFQQLLKPWCRNRRRKMTLILRQWKRNWRYSKTHSPLQRRKMIWSRIWCSDFNRASKPLWLRNKLSLMRERIESCSSKTWRNPIRSYESWLSKRSETLVKRFRQCWMFISNRPSRRRCRLMMEWIRQSKSWYSKRQPLMSYRNRIRNFKMIWS